MLYGKGGTGHAQFMQHGHHLSFNGGKGILAPLREFFSQLLKDLSFFVQPRLQFLQGLNHSR